MGYGDDRDYADLEDKNLAVYNFRGYTVFRYNKAKKQIKAGNNASMCGFIKDDMIKLSRFLELCYKHANGEIADVENVEVN